MKDAAADVQEYAGAKHIGERIADADDADMVLSEEMAKVAAERARLMPKRPSTLAAR